MLLVLGLVAHALTSIAFAVGYDDGDVMWLGVLLALGVVLAPPFLAVRTRRAFRWIAGAYAVVTFVAFFAGGVLVAPGVLLLVAAAFAPPPPDEWAFPRWLLWVLAGTAVLLGLTALVLTVR